LLSWSFYFSFSIWVLLPSQTHNAIRGPNWRIAASTLQSTEYMGLIASLPGGNWTENCSTC
jgi:hypothetical protein